MDSLVTGSSRDRIPALEIRRDENTTQTRQKVELFTLNYSYFLLLPFHDNNCLYPIFFFFRFLHENEIESSAFLVICYSALLLFLSYSLLLQAKSGI